MFFGFCYGPPVGTAPRDHQLPTTNRANRQPPPTTNHRQLPAATNRQPPTTANRHQPPIPSHQPPPTATNRHQLPVANRQPPTTNAWCARGLFWENCVTEQSFFFLLRTALRQGVVAFHRESTQRQQPTQKRTQKQVTLCMLKGAITCGHKTSRGFAGLWRTPVQIWMHPVESNSLQSSQVNLQDPPPPVPMFRIVSREEIFWLPRTMAGKCSIQPPAGNNQLRWVNHQLQAVNANCQCAHGRSVWANLWSRATPRGAAGSNLDPAPPLQTPQRF